MIMKRKIISIGEKDMITVVPEEDKIGFPQTPFTCVSVGRAFELLRHDMMLQMEKLQKEIGFKYCRFHGLFHDEMAVVRRKEDGTLAFQWNHIDKLFDNLKSVSIKPFVELGAMPKALASGESTIFYWKMNTSEPKDYSEWGQLVSAFVEHMIQRYGFDEVKTWYFEVWNEPNLKGFWPAGMEAYYKLYEVSAREIKAISPKLRVGGPSTAGGALISEMIDVCDKRNIPLDFITTHCYPCGEQCEYPDKEHSPYESGMYFIERFHEVYEQVKNSKMPQLEIHWTEWNTMSWKWGAGEVDFITNPCNDNHFSAGCIVRNMLGVADYCDSASFWTVSDMIEESGMPHSVFSANMGMITVGGIPKASYNAFLLLKKLRGEKMKCVYGGYPAGFGAAAAYEEGVTKVLLYNSQIPDDDDNAETVNDTVEIPAPDGVYIVSTAAIKKGHGSCYESWAAMGMPQDLSPMQAEVLKAHSTPEYGFRRIRAHGGKLKIDFSLSADDVMYLEVQKECFVAMPRDTGKVDIEKWNSMVTLERRALDSLMEE